MSEQQDDQGMGIQALGQSAGGCEGRSVDVARDTQLSHARFGGLVRLCSHLQLRPASPAPDTPCNEKQCLSQRPDRPR